MWQHPSGAWWFPRWLRVRVVSRKTDGTAVANIGETRLEVALERCACGVEFATHKNASKRQCKSCDQQQRADDQRNRRLKRRRPALHTQCARCGAQMDAQRTTKQYCSGACRTATMRLRRMDRATETAPPAGIAEART
jgi:C4-dicarboxylate-specific signal transduction histidine kinase